MPFDSLIPVLMFAAGALIAGGLAYLLGRRQISATESASLRVRELEHQFARQAEELNSQLAAKTRSHSEELERNSRERRDIQDQYLAELKIKVRESEDRGYEEGKRQAELRADEKSKAFSVTVRPYIKKIKDDGFLKKMNRLQVGYQYQLQINGIPCFDPHVVIEQHYEEREVNQEVIERMTRLALEAARTAVAIQAGPAGAFIPIATSPVIEG
jgi:hypothetical protein